MSLYNLYKLDYMAKVKQIISNISGCFNSNADINSILYSRCLLYIVLFISLVNLFYLININNTTTIVIFFLVGFITSFFVRNMIIILLVSIVVSFAFQMANNEVVVDVRKEYFNNDDEEEEKKETFDEEEEKEYFDEDEEKEYFDEDEERENFDEDEEKENFENEEEEKEKENFDDEDEEKKSKDENFKFQYQGQQMDEGKDTEEDVDVTKPDANAVDTSVKKEKYANSKKTNKYESFKPADNKSTSTQVLKKQMSEYFEMQKSVLDKLEEAENLQKKAENFREKFKSK